MSVFVFVTIDAGGNVPPAMELGRELLARGHRVRFLGHERQRTSLTGAGFEYTAFRRMSFLEPTQPRPPHKGIANFLHFSTDPGPGQDLLDLLAEEPADLVVIDCMLLSVLRAVQRSGQNHAVLFHSFYHFWDTQFVKGPAGVLARLKGHNAKAIWGQAPFQLVVSSMELDPAAPAATPTRLWSGVVEKAHSTAEADGEPAVLVSLSTLWTPRQDDVYQRILLAFRVPAGEGDRDNRAGSGPSQADSPAQCRGAHVRFSC